MKWSGNPDLDALNGRTGRLYDSDGDRIVWVAAIAALVIAALVMVGW